MIGAPWLDAYKLADIMNKKGFEGVMFRPVYFEPTFSKHKGELCKGVQVHVTDKRKVKAVEVGINLLYEVMDMDKERFEWLPPFKEGSHYFIDLLSGTDEIRNRRFEADGFIEKWRKQSKDFIKIKEQYHLY
jgi:uncharacterized protein YbbC (DUF1343 family)